MEDQDLAQKIAQHNLQGQAICTAMIAALEKIGFKNPSISFEALDFFLAKDPFNGSVSLQGNWRNPKGYSTGSLIFYPEGNFYAEYEVIKPHPKKKQFVVEAITAWGKGDEIKTEARLLDVL